MICPNCGTENAEGAPFCSNCATPLPVAAQGWPSAPGAGQPGEGQRTVAAGTPLPPATPGGQWPGQAPAGYPPTAPGAIPPGGGAQPPYIYGGPPAGGPPPKPPRNALVAGLGAFVAFLVVAGIGLVLFLTVFKKDAPATPPPGPTVTTPPGPTVTTPPPTGPSPSPTTPGATETSPGPTDTGTSPIVDTTTPPRDGDGDGDGAQPVLRIFVCKNLVGGTTTPDGAVVGADPSGCQTFPFVGSRSLPGFIVMFAAINFPPNLPIEAAVVDVQRRTVIQRGSLLSTGVPRQQFFLPVPAPRGGFPEGLFAVGVLVDGQPVGFPVRPEVILI
jgi:zinc-ribbon domain